MVEYINIDKNSIPYKFDMQLSRTTYTLEVNYNAEHDFFTLDLSQNGIDLVLGEKLVYGNPVFETVRNSKFPGYMILPYNPTDTVTRITYDNFNESVFLYLINRSDLLG